MRCRSAALQNERMRTNASARARDSRRRCARRTSYSWVAHVCVLVVVVPDGHVRVLHCVLRCIRNKQHQWQAQCCELVLGMKV